MIELTGSQTIGAVLREARAALWRRAVPDGARPIRPAATLQQGESAASIGWTRSSPNLAACYADAGYGAGHRIGLLLENRLAHFEHKLALNTIGAWCVPLNPDHRPAEMGYVIGHARVDLVVVLPALAPLLRRGDDAFRAPCRQWCCSTMSPIGCHRRSPASGDDGRAVEHRHRALHLGDDRPAEGMPAVASLRAGERRIGTRPADSMPFGTRPTDLQPASGLSRQFVGRVSFYGALFTGNCQIQAGRFQTSRWWQEVRESGATVVHYLGVIVPMCSISRRTADDRGAQVRFGIGAGVDPQRHARVRARFGFPLIEIWGMTEMVRLLSDAGRHVGRHACLRRPLPGLDVRIVDDTVRATRRASRARW